MTRQKHAKKTPVQTPQETSAAKTTVLKKKRRIWPKLLLIGLGLIVAHLYLMNVSVKVYPVRSHAAPDDKVAQFTGLSLESHPGDKTFKQDEWFQDIVSIDKDGTDLNAVAPAVGGDEMGDGLESDKGYAVQAVLAAKRSAVISSTMDGTLKHFPLQNGDMFKKGGVIAKYDCGMDWARLKELKARERLSAKKTAAFKRLLELKTASEIEYVTALENNNQDKALISQLRHKLNFCAIHAPFAGRVSRKMASQYEAVQKGRVLMEIISAEPMQAELLMPSKWLRWANIGTPLSVYIEESGKTYTAKIIRIHGEVDPVSQSAHVVAELEKYAEELLPGMSGRAIFSLDTVGQKEKVGFLGIVFEDPATEEDLIETDDAPPAMPQGKQEKEDKAPAQNKNTINQKTTPDVKGLESP